MNRIQGLVDLVFNEIPPVYLIIGSTVVFFGMGLLAFFVRSKAAQRPISPVRIILPPVFMSSGLLMFLFTQFQVPKTQVIEAMVVGLLFSTILIATTNFEHKDGKLFVKRSKAFIFILAGLLVFRLVAKLILSSSIDVGELAGMFFILAFSMIIPWRIGMLVKYKRLKKREGLSVR
ncbi:protein CcdC [Sporosarcina sp. NCCP-2716]|uniref:CcdC family protein n=1 Tax=Sporosarcina sp. NCCP-2716 TaxID=2943679 RepID=UPI0020402FD9|nr:cytochrome c biogenesis protein CcdC [Sporosarcina sp. NCCP-2716]GKV68242.1 protein CcdC [Sporosarcina sp. NCCP-2716]